MLIELTRQSATEYENILYSHMTPAMAADYLQNGRLTMRQFPEVLKELYPASDRTSRLTDFFVQVTPNANDQSISRKIRNWMTGKNKPSGRTELFCIAFALGFNEQKLNYILSFCTGYGIQYRDNREVIFTWFLRNGRSYTEAVEFFNSLPPIQEKNQAHSKRTSRLTHEMATEFQVIQTLDDLRKYYIKNLSNFGNMHLRAYYYFEKYLNQLIHPSPHWDTEAAEPDYSLDAVMDTYLSLHVPSDRKRTSYTVVQKLLKQNWPNTTSIKRIRNHQEDVPRKLLLLLYVVTENEVSAADLYDELDEEYIPLEDRVEYHWWTLNAILEDCGMTPLDPRNTTDWLILYAISSDTEEPMSDRLKQVLSCVFDSVSIS